MDVPCSAATSAGGRCAAQSACCAVTPPVLSMTDKRHLRHPLSLSWDAPALLTPI